MGEEQGVDFCEWNLKLLNALSSASAAVEEQLLLPCLDEDAWAKPIHPGLWGTCTQEGDLKLLARSSHC